MFPWRKRNEGFEWREYVRTTILVRRGDRRRRIEEAKAAAVADLKQAGRKGADAAGQGLRGAGRLSVSAASGLAALPGRIFRVLSPILGPVFAGVAGVCVSGQQRLFGLLEPAFVVLRRREIRLPLMLFGTIATIGAVVRYLRHGFDHEVTYAAIIAAVALVLTALPAYADGARLHLVRRARNGLSSLGLSAPSLTRADAMRPGVIRGGVVMGLVAILAGSLWYAWTLIPSVGPTLAMTKDGSAIEGSAVAVSGDRLRIAGRVISLAGIEAPEREQTCQRPRTGTWRCGDAARSVLDRMVRGGRVSCVVDGSAESGPVEGHCSVNGEDIAANLVKGGHAFATPGVFSKYASLESEAQSANIGVWFGSAERPSEFRAKKWEEAKRNAPEGCPIKGQVSGRARTYVLPWSPSYDAVKIRSARGERWFCSEEEARAAGWRATARS